MSTKSDDLARDVYRGPGRPFRNDGGRVGAAQTMANADRAAPLDATLRLCLHLAANPSG